jgi:hypothetical protein
MDCFASLAMTVVVRYYSNPGRGTKFISMLA